MFNNQKSIPSNNRKFCSYLDNFLYFQSILVLYVYRFKFCYNVGFKYRTWYNVKYFVILNIWLLVSITHLYINKLCSSIQRFFSFLKNRILVVFMKASKEQLNGIVIVTRYKSYNLVQFNMRSFTCSSFFKPLIK